MEVESPDGLCSVPGEFILPTNCTLGTAFGTQTFNKYLKTIKGLPNGVSVLVHFVKSATNPGFIQEVVKKKKVEQVDQEGCDCYGYNAVVQQDSCLI